MSTTTQQFQMHAQLLHSMIARQAGTVSKAVLEGVMNAVDAKATECRITLDEQRLTIRDDGHGFRSRKQIRECFGVFGQPHDESEQKVYGAFRMGRGQLFAFGVNEWRTGWYRMTVDFKNRGADYTIEKMQQKTPGCGITVDLYDKLYPYALTTTAEEIKRWCQWFPIAVYVNDELVSKSPTDKTDWDVVTDDAYIQLTPQGSLDVYNLGAFVQGIYGSRYGTGGIIVSRKQLSVNFARNEVMASCDVWKRILKEVESRTAVRVAKGKSLNTAERDMLGKRLLLQGYALPNAHSLRLFTAVTGQHFSLTALLRRQCWTTAAQGDPLGDKLHRRGQAFVLSKEQLRRFGAEDAAGLQQALLRMMEAQPQWWRRAIKHLKSVVPTSFELLAAGLNDCYELIPADALRPTEEVWLDLLTSLQAELVPTIVDEVDDPDNRLASVVKTRQLRIGIAEADGWTDGVSYIAISREYLARQQLDPRGICNVGSLLIHELCHDQSDLGAHPHDQEFYELFHDTVARQLGDFVAKAVARLGNTLPHFQRKLTKRQLHTADCLARTADAAKVIATAIPNT